MKLKMALATATALGLTMGMAWAGSNNKTFSIQNGQENLLSVDQDGNNNVAGVRTNYTEYLGQFGDSNSISVTQHGDYNRVANTGPSSAGAIQNNDRNVLVIDQTSGATGYSGGQNGNIVNRVRQTGTVGALATTNRATITQSLGPDSASVVGGPAVASHYVGNVEQTNTGGTVNELDVTQTGAYSHWYSGGQGNRLNTVKQNGSGNKITATQEGTGPVLSTSGLQQRGPSNVINKIEQTGANNEATVAQNGFQNYVESVSQGGVGGNIATINLTGDHNGATASSGNGYPTIGMFTSGRGAEMAGASASTVSQSGSDNQVNYTVNGGNSNQFGFYQNNTGNTATGIYITGNSNELGVYQDGTNNSLTLASISGDDNIIGLHQEGTDNTANLSISGSQNVGHDDFGTGPAGDLAGSQNLTAGLMKQYGTFNQVSLTVSGGNNNVFASLQNNRDYGGPSTQNAITATQDGSGNQAAVVQLGNNNNASLSQTGGMNSASISQ